jgi:hypothetical protein
LTIVIASRTAREAGIAELGRRLLKASAMKPKSYLAGTLNLALQQTRV